VELGVKLPRTNIEEGSMQYTILDAQGKTQGTVQAETLAAACRSWASQNWDDHIVDAAVLKVKHYPLTPPLEGAYMDPYVVSPAGYEGECMKKYVEQFSNDVHFAPDPLSTDQPRQVDTGGGD
jgi:hypothetical protein